MFRSVKGLSGFAQLGILLAFLGLGFILAGIVQLLIGLKMVPDNASVTDPGVLANAMLEPKNVTYTRISQVIGTFFLFFIPAILFNLVAYGRNMFWLGFNRFFNSYQVLIAIFIILAGNFVAAPLVDLSKAVVSHFPDLDKLAKQLEEAYNAQVKILSNLRSWPEFLAALAIMAFFPAMFEEIFFRGVLQNLFERWWRIPWLAILVTSIIFSIFHASVYVFATRIVLGCVLGITFYLTRNIWINIIAHFINNGIALLQLFLLSKNNKPIEVESLDPKLDWGWTILAFLILAGLFMLMRNVSKVLRETIRNKELALVSRQNIQNPFEQSEWR